MQGGAHIVIHAEHVGKRYRLGQVGGATLSEDVGAWFSRLRGRPDPRVPIGREIDRRLIGSDFWALRDVGFEVEQGGMLGIIGRNGAGKSTLLKLLSRITRPTTGEIRMRGRVSSLLEVGTGFNPELTGRDNIFLNGAILGMRKAEIRRKLDEIIDFSGVQQHIDTPVKRYSSGMKVRLGFSVAAHLEPEILIIDEVLAVGDAEFQRKCMGKMRDVTSSGRTVLFVSHNMVAVRSLCHRVLWLNDGRVVADGPTDEVVTAYLKEQVGRSERIDWSGDEAPGTSEVQLVHVGLHRGNGELLHCDQPFGIEIGFINRAITDGDLRVNIHLYNGSEVLVLASALAESAPDENIGTPGSYRYRCIVPGELLNADEYRVVVNFVRKGKLLFRQEETIAFQIHDRARAEGVGLGRRLGVIRPRLSWQRQ